MASIHPFFTKCMILWFHEGSDHDENIARPTMIIVKQKASHSTKAHDEDDDIYPELGLDSSKPPSALISGSTSQLA